MAMRSFFRSAQAWATDLASPSLSSGKYDTTAGQLYYDADGSGSGQAQLVATIAGHPAIAATDITVI